LGLKGEANNASATEILRVPEMSKRAFFDIGWEDNIRTDLKETRCVGAGWIRLAQDGV
jgi:hypothetical protein